MTSIHWAAAAASSSQPDQRDHEFLVLCQKWGTLLRLGRPALTPVLTPFLYIAQS